MRNAILLEPVLAEIVEGCLQNDRSSQRKFYKYFYGLSYALCKRYITTHEDIVECVNDGFLKVFNGLHFFEKRQPDLELSLRSWMKRIMINTCIDRLRKNRNYKNTFTEQEITSDSAVIHEDVLAGISSKEIISCINELSPAYKIVFNLFVLDGYSHEEIAGMLNITTGSSKSNLARARVNLQKILQSKNYCGYEQAAI